MTSSKSPNDFLVHGLSNVEPAYDDFPGTMYAGLLPTNNKDRVGEMMFWLFEPQEQSVSDTLVVWLNGGPGCSSFNCGVMMEHSPVTQPLRPAGYCCLSGTPPLSYNEHTWTKATTMLYVEHPIGTGFSYGHPLPETEHEANADLYAFMQNFYEVFDHFQSYKFYVMGESYAGMFVPSIARYFHLQNAKAQEDNKIVIPLTGAAIGNGWMDAKVQGPATIDYSWWHGLIDKPTRDALHTEWHDCMSGTSKTEPPPFHPFTVQDDCGIMWGVLQAAGQPNAYDITTWDPNVDQVTFTSEAFYNQVEVKQALHAPLNVTWHGCRQGEGRRKLLQEQRRLYMDNDRPLSVVPYVADLLDAGIPVLLYNGDRDMTTNMVGTELLLNDMEWSGQDDWLDAKRGLWMTDKYESGWAKELGPLKFVVVYNSGHMVPYNQPVPAFDLLTRFLKNESFMDTELPTLRVKDDDKKHDDKATSDGAFLVPASTTDMPKLIHQVGTSRLETFALVAVSMVVGAVLALLMVRKARSSRGNYQRVPDVEVVSH